MTVADTDKVYRIESNSFYRPLPKKDLINDIEKNKHKECFVYEKNGEKYFKGIIYYNALAKGSKGARTLNIDWISAKQTERIADMRVYPAQGKPAYDLDDMKIYKVYPYRNDRGQLTNEKNMPLSFGVRPEQYPDKYELVFDKENINPENYFSERQGGFNVTYMLH